MFSYENMKIHFWIMKYKPFVKESAFNINSACPEEPYRAEDREIIVVSRSYPTKIGQNWTCIYNFFTPDKTQARSSFNSTNLKLLSGPVQSTDP